MAVLFILILTGIVLLLVQSLLPRRLKHLVGRQEMAAAALLPLFATFSFHYLIFTLLVGGLVILLPAVGPAGTWLPSAATADRRLRLLMFCLPLLPLLPFTFWVGSISLFQLNYVIILCLAFALTMGGIRLPRAARQLSAWDTLFCIMLLVQLFIDVRQADLTSSVRIVLQLGLSTALLYFVISRSTAATTVPHEMMFALILGACIISAVAVFESFCNWLLYNLMPLQIGADPDTTSAYAKQRGGMLRARSTFPESTGLSLFLGLCVTFLFALRRQLAAPKLSLAIAFILMAGVFLTFARVGYIAVIVGVVSCLIFEGRLRRLLQMLAALPVAGGAMYASAQWIPAVAASIGVAEDAAASIDYRSQLLDAGLEVIRDYPLLGMGFQELCLRLAHLRQGEGFIDFVNQPLTIMMRAGILGTILYFTMTACVLVALISCRRRMEPTSRSCAAGLFGAIISLLIGLTTTSYGRNEATMMLLLAASAGLIAKAKASAKLPTAPSFAPTSVSIRLRPATAGLRRSPTPRRQRDY